MVLSNALIVGSGGRWKCTSMKIIGSYDLTCFYDDYEQQQDLAGGIRIDNYGMLLIPNYNKRDKYTKIRINRLTHNSRLPILNP